MDTTDMDMVLAMLAIMAMLDITVHTLMDTDTIERDLLNQLPNPLLMLKPMLMRGMEDTDMVDTHTTVDTDMEDMPTDHTDTMDTEVTGVKQLLIHSKCSYHGRTSLFHGSYSFFFINPVDSIFYQFLQNNFYEIVFC